MADPTLETQNLARSCHEALILATLADRQRHGYQLALEIEERSGGAFRFNHGTLYPILHALEASGLISGSWDEAAGRRKRRQYALTKRGREHLTWLRGAWAGFCTSLHNVIGEDAP